MVILSAIVPNLAENMKIELKDTVFQRISRLASEKQIPVYLIGGYVRDMVMNRPTVDIDIMCVGSGIQFAQAVAEDIGNAKVQVFKSFGTAMVNYKNVQLEFVGARKESYRSASRNPIVEDGTLEDDIQRRDFTINTLAISLNEEDFGTVLDPFGGLNHIKEKIIQTPLPPDKTFSDDPLRMLRAIRFASQLEFEIHPETLESIKRNKDRVSILSTERITEELNKIILSSKPSIGFLLMDKTGLLELIFPELHATKGVEKIQNKKHKDNFLHTIQVLDNITPYTDNLWLRWATLLHDIAKPLTKRFEPEIGWTFYGHNHYGAKMIPTIFKQMKLPLNEKMKYVQKLVNLHMRPVTLVQETVTDSAIRRLLFEAGDDIDDLMTLCEADITSGNKEKVKKYLSNFNLVRQKLREIESKDKVRNWQPPVSGEEIMEVFNIAPSKAVGDIKKVIREAILDGHIHNSREEAWALMLDTGKEMGLSIVKPEMPVQKTENDTK